MKAEFWSNSLFGRTTPAWLFPVLIVAVAAVLVTDIILLVVAA